MFYRFKGQKLLPYALHLTMVIAVAIYVLAGALAIRHIEATQANVNGLTKRTKRGEIGGIKHSLQPMQRSRRCVLAALHQISGTTKCYKKIHNDALLSHIDRCYDGDVVKKFDATRNRTKKFVQSDDGEGKVEGDIAIWSLMDAILFCFTVITTIGYGNVAPQTTEGRLFVILYGLVGIPFTMLAIANLGKFLAELLKHWSEKIISLSRRVLKRRTKQNKALSKENEALVASTTSDGRNEVVEVETWGEALILFIAFFLYIVIGSIIIATYETEMDFFGAIYFNFVSLTTVGLGDLVPKNETYLFFTLTYCAVGLALTTIAIEIAANYLKKLHYFGRTIDNVANIQIWFGGKKLTMKQLVRNLGDQFNLPVDQVADLNLDQFVDSAIKVEAGELATLRTGPLLRPVHLDSESVVYVDADEYSLYQGPISAQAATENLLPRLATPTLAPYDEVCHQMKSPVINSEDRKSVPETTSLTSTNVNDLSMNTIHRWNR